VANSPNFLILDGHSLAYRAFHALPVENFATSSGQHTNAVYGFVSMLVNVLKERQPTHIAVAFDISRDTFRSRIYPAYKATRAKTPPEFAGQVELIKQILEALNIAVVTADGFEADDILATLAHASSVPVSIVSGDRDSFQLITDDVTILYPKKGMSDLAIMNAAAVEEKYGVPPERYRDLAALVGESSDNLPGVPGVGPKTAAKWITQYGSLEAILADQEAIGGKVGDALREHADQVAQNYELNRLVEDAPVATDVDGYAKRDYDPTLVHDTFDALEFAALRPRLFAAWPSGQEGSATVAVAESTEVESFEIESTQVNEKLLATWLSTHDTGVIALAFSGHWARGTGSINNVALVSNSGDSVWCDFVEGGQTLNDWLESDQPKVIHDAKGPLTALIVNGVSVNGLSCDTAIAAYLVAPGGRDFELSSLVLRYLKKSLEPLATAEPAQMLFDDQVQSGSVLASSAHATLDLSEHLVSELTERGGVDLMREVELPLIDVLARMEVAGIAVDVDLLRALESSFDADSLAAVKQAHASAGREFNLGSPKQLQEVLFEERGLPKTKKIKTGYTTDAEALQSLLAKFPDDELLTALLRYREVTKLKQTVSGLLACVADDGRIHTTFNQMVAATGRLSSTDPNLQNIPIRTQEGMRIRETFVVGKGYETLLTADYSQIELRVMAHLSGDKGLIAALNSGEDLHTTVGSQVFGVPTDQVDADMRRKIKAMSYGLAYGLSAYGLAQQLGTSNEEARNLMDTYFERFGGVRDYLANVVAEARKLGYTESIMGRRRYLPDLNSDNRQLRDVAERMALNAPIQGSAADLVKVAMLKVDQALKEADLKSRLLLQVHDELIVEVAPGELEKVQELVVTHMHAAADLAVPLDVSVGTGHSWSQAAH
jgi:DNA polymerase-1